MNEPPADRGALNSSPPTHMKPTTHMIEATIRNIPVCAVASEAKINNKPEPNSNGDEIADKLIDSRQIVEITTPRIEKPTKATPSKTALAKIFNTNDSNILNPLPHN